MLCLNNNARLHLNKEIKKNSCEFHFVQFNTIKNSIISKSLFCEALQFDLGRKQTVQRLQRLKNYEHHMFMLILIFLITQPEICDNGLLLADLERKCQCSEFLGL